MPSDGILPQAAAGVDPELEIAGLAVSGLSFALNFFKTAKDALSWDEQDIEVDAEWLDVAIEKGILPGPGSDYGWMSERRVPTAELKRTVSPVIAHNDERKIKYRLFQGKPTDAGGRNMLVKKIGPQ